MTGLHSPWGTIWSICEATGWTFKYVLWKISWINIRMMLADAPRYVTGKKKQTEEDFLEDFCNE